MTLPKLLEIYREFNCEDEFRRMVVADCITLNSDRHFGNFGFLVNNESFECIALEKNYSIPPADVMAVAVVLKLLNLGVNAPLQFATSSDDAQ